MNTTPTVTGLYIPADAAAPVRVVQVTPTLAGCRDYVGAPGRDAYLEAIDLTDCHLYVDEDGRDRGLAPNRRASELAAGTVLGGDDLRGDVLVLGSTAGGDEASLTVRTLARLAASLHLPDGSLA